MATEKNCPSEESSSSSCSSSSSSSSSEDEGQSPGCLDLFMCSRPDLACMGDDDFESAEDLKAKQAPTTPVRHSRPFLPPHDKKHSMDDYFDVDWKGTVLGEGGYAAVYRCTERHTHAEMALKAMQKDKIPDKKRLQMEIELATRCTHPNIVRLTQSFEDNRFIYLIQELCAGGELFDRIVEQGHLSERQGAIIMQQIFRAVFYLHSQGICHRDLKPENFLFLAKGPVETNTLKMIDFGISKEFSGPEDRFFTKTGTAYYVAPDVIGPPTGYGPECDLWSCGVVMYVLLSGCLPFRGNNDKETFAKIRMAKYNLTNSLWKNVSADAKTLIRSLLQKDIKKRVTAKQALSNVWVKDHAPRAKKVELNQAVVESLQCYQCLHKFKKAALQAVARQMGPSEISELQAIFTELDEDGNGTLTTAELLEGLHHVSGPQLGTADELRRLIEGIDADESGQIDYTEFLAATMARKQFCQEQNCWNAFRAFDLDGDGLITHGELSKVLSAGNLQMSQDQISGLMKEVDSNGDGVIDFDEFMVMMRRLDTVCPLHPGSD